MSDEEKAKAILAMRGERGTWQRINWLRAMTAMWQERWRA